MTSAKHLSLALMALTFALGACKKDDDEPATPSGGGGTPAPSAPSTTPNFDGADGSLWAVKTFTTQSTPIGPISFEVGLGVAAFSNDNYANMVNVGAVSLNGTALTAASNNAYTSSVSPTNPTGVDLSSVEWNVAGGSGFTGFTRNVNGFAMPTVSEITSGTTVTRSAGYTLSCGSVSGADSVMFLVGGVAKTLGAGNNACTFSASELSGLSAGSNLVQIAAYRYTNETIEGKVIYFGKETVRNQSVTIQ